VSPKQRNGTNALLAVITWLLIMNLAGNEARHHSFGAQKGAAVIFATQNVQNFVSCVEAGEGTEEQYYVH